MKKLILASAIICSVALSGFARQTASTQKANHTSKGDAKRSEQPKTNGGEASKSCGGANGKGCCQGGGTSCGHGGDGGVKVQSPK